MVSSRERGGCGGEMAFNPLGARGSAESVKEVGTSVPRCQVRKLRQGGSASSGGDWISPPEPLPSTEQIPLSVSRLEKREGAKQAGKTVRRRVRIPGEEALGPFSPPAGPSPHLGASEASASSPHPALPGPRADASRPGRSPLQPAAPAPLPAAPPPGPGASPARRRGLPRGCRAPRPRSPRSGARSRASRPLGPSRRAQGPGGAAPRAPGRGAPSPRRPGSRSRRRAQLRGAVGRGPPRPVGAHPGVPPEQVARAAARPSPPLRSPPSPLPPAAPPPAAPCARPPVPPAPAAAAGELAPRGGGGRQCPESGGRSAAPPARAWSAPPRPPPLLGPGSPGRASPLLPALRPDRRPTGTGSSRASRPPALGLYNPIAPFNR